MLHEEEEEEGRMSKSPIDVMIDKACGITAEYLDRLLTLRCPYCHTEKRVERDWYDPALATVAVYPCGICRREEKDYVVYLDRNGREVT